MKHWKNLCIIRMRLRINLVERLRQYEVIEVVNMVHRSISYVKNMVLFTKLLRLIHLSKMELLNVKNRTLKEMMNAMLISSGLPQNLWGEALLSTNYILNKLPHEKLDKTPYSLWKGWSPSYKYLKVWGCLAKVMVPIPKRIKIGPKTIDCIFFGYAINSSAYRFLVHKYDIPDIHVNTIIESRNASFFKNIFPSKNACDESSLKRTHDTATSDIDRESLNNESEEALRRSKRVRTSKSFDPDFLTYFLENEPQSFNEAMSTPEAPMWKEAVNSEIESIMQNHT